VTTVRRSFLGRVADAIHAFEGGGRSGARGRVRPRSFKGAEVSRIYSDWVASLVSSHDELRGDLRTIRARARELSRNNAYAGRFLELVTTNVLGPFGPRLKAQARKSNEDLDKELNLKIEAAWLEWSQGPVTADRTMSFPELQTLALMTTAREGENFLRRVHDRSFTHGLALQVIDPDLVDDSYTLQGPRMNPEIYLGVEVDSLGRRLAYHVLDYPYGPGYAGRGRIRVPASDVIHAYRVHRANQMRGVTWMARSMAPLKDEERYAQNELVASAAGAAKMGFITNEAGGVGAVTTDPITEGEAASSDGSGTSGGSKIAVDAEPGSIWELDPGQAFEGWSPDHPSTAFGAFTSAILRRSASGFDVGYEPLTGDYSQVTYLSARASQLVERMVWAKLQHWWIRVFLQPVFDWWLEAAWMSGALQLPGGDWRRYRNVIWRPRGWRWIDPSKDAAAAREMLGLNLTTRTRLLAEQGEDFEDLLEEQAEELKLAREYKVELTTPDSPSGGSGPRTPRDPDDDEDEGEEEDPDDAPYDADARKKREARKNGNGKRGAGRVFARS